MRKDSRSNGRRKRAPRGSGRLFKKIGNKQVPADSNAAGSFYLTFTIPGGKRKTVALRNENNEAITDRKAAEIARRRILAPYQTGDQVETLKAIRARIRDAEEIHETAVDEANPPLRVKGTWRAYLRTPERPDSGEATLTRYKGHWQRFEQWLKTTDPDADFLRDVTPGTAADYAADLVMAKYSPNTFNKHIGFLRLLFRTLSDTARIRTNPFARIKRKVQRPHSRRELTIPELTTILDHTDGELSLLLHLGACTGLRLGDCCTLSWGEVDLVRGIIRRIPNKTAKSGKPVVVGIPPALHTQLSETPAKKRLGYVLPKTAKRYGRGVDQVTNQIKALLLDCGIDVHASGTGKRIKRDAEGVPMRNEDTGKVTLEDTGKPAVVDVGFHSLRHTWVSMHAAAGTPGAVIQASVGHANPAMTQHYTHVNETTARDVARALPAFVGEKEPHKEPLPDWARELVETLTARNAKTVKAALLKGGAR